MTFKDYMTIINIRQVTMSGINTCFSIMTLMDTPLPPLWWPEIVTIPSSKGDNQTWAFPNSASRGLIRETLHFIFSLWKFIIHIRILKAQKILTVKKRIWFCLTWYFLNVFDPLFFTITAPLCILKKATTLSNRKQPY